MSTVPGLWAMLCSAQIFPAVRTAAARGNNDLLGVDVADAVLLAQADALADGILEDDVLALGTEQHLNTGVGQIVLDVQVELLGLLGAQMADGAVNELQTRLNGALADVLDVGTS